MLNTIYVVQTENLRHKTAVVRSPCECYLEKFLWFHQSFVIFVIASENSWKKYLQFKNRLRLNVLHALYYIYGNTIIYVHSLKFQGIKVF